MAKPFDLTKLRSGVASKAKIEAGWHDPYMWLDTGNYALNKMISGSFFKGVPMGKVTVFAGESGCLPETACVRVRLTKKS